jgi:hypothetical protein
MLWLGCIYAGASKMDFEPIACYSHNPLNNKIFLAPRARKSRLYCITRASECAPSQSAICDILPMRLGDALISPCAQKAIWCYCLGSQHC